ncbi:unnamed protein product [Chrysoparadoxa australica]
MQEQRQQGLRAVLSQLAAAFQTCKIGSPKPEARVIDGRCEAAGHNMVLFRQALMLCIVMVTAVRQRREQDRTEERAIGPCIGACIDDAQHTHTAQHGKAYKCILTMEPGVTALLYPWQPLLKTTSACSSSNTSSILQTLQQYLQRGKLAHLDK